MAERHTHAKPLASRAATMGAGHVGLGPGLIDENQALGVQVDLPVEPGLALAQDVGAVVLAACAVFFLRVSP